MEVFTSSDINYVKMPTDGGSGAYPLSVYSGSDEVIKIDDGHTQIKTGLKDKDANLGSSGQVLTSTGTQVDWKDATEVNFPSGTKMIFYQSSAPTGWTKDTSRNDVALRIVSGGGGGTYHGGDGAFSAIFASNRQTNSGSVNSRTLNTNQIPKHNHPYKMGYFAENNGNLANPNDIAGSNKGNDWDNNAFTTDRNTSDQSQGGTGHDHGFTNPRINLQPHYVDVIICSKD